MNQYNAAAEHKPEPEEPEHGAGLFAFLLIGMVLLFIFGSCNAPPIQEKRRPIPTTKKATERTPPTTKAK